MNTNRKDLLKAKIIKDLALSPRDDSRVSIVCHEKVADCFVAYLKKTAFQWTLPNSCSTGVDQGLMRFYISIPPNEAEKLCSDFVQALQVEDLETIQYAHPYIFIGYQTWPSKSDDEVSELKRPNQSSALVNG